MSFVGPRLALFNQHDIIVILIENGVHKMVPGLIGCTQVNGRDESPLNLKVRLEAEYLIRRSFKLDIYIFWRTVLKVLAKEGVLH